MRFPARAVQIIPAVEKELRPDWDRMRLDEVEHRGKQTGGSGGSLEPPGPLLTHLLTHLHTVYMA
jgi:hypothetical protein